MIRNIKDNKVDGISIQDDKYWLVKYGSGEFRTYLSNKYMWYIYSVFVRENHFNNTAKCHKDFGEMFLSVEDKFNNDNFIEWMETFQSKCRNDIPIIKKERAYPNILITWVLSTAKLNKKEFSSYVDNVKDKGYELGLEFSSFDKWVNSL